MIIVYHCPKQGAKRVTKEDASSDDYVFFPPLDNPLYMNRQLYWFSTNWDTAKSHADYWIDQNNTKWGLTLICGIPDSSERKHGDCFCNVHPKDIVIIDRIWW
jgi:hypothetical protein